MGNDAIGLARTVVQFAVGGTMLILGIPFFIYIYRRNCVAYPLLASKTKVAFLTVKKEYKGVNSPIHDDAGPWGYAVSFFIFVGMCAAIMFIH